MRAAIMRTVTGLLTSPKRRALMRRIRSLPRILGGRMPEVLYFHQQGDPYSELTVQLLDRLRARYDITLTSYLVPPPDDAAAPEREKLASYGREDAAMLAKAYGLIYPNPGQMPMPLAGDAAAGGELRAKLGHYLSAMFYFEGEWFWGIDRLHHLENRLAQFTKADAGPLVAPLREAFSLAPVDSGATLDFYASFRSPYTHIAAKRVRELAARHNATLRIRFVLPMVMRGLPVPKEKRLYITLDTKREAERLGLPFGKVVDPVGKGVERGLALLHHAIPAGKGSALAESFLQGVFADGIDSASDEGLSQIATRAGLSAAEVSAALADESWRAVAEANREELFSLGLWGVPSFRVNNMRPHWGQDRLWAVEEDLAAAAAQRAGGQNG